jgi:hypothetical protein
MNRATAVKIFSFAHFDKAKSARGESGAQPSGR